MSSIIRSALSAGRRATTSAAKVNQRGLRTSPFVFLDQQSAAASTQAPANSLAYEKQMDSFATGEEFADGEYAVSQVAGPSHVFKRVPLGAYPMSVPYEQENNSVEEAQK